MIDPLDTDAARARQADGMARAEEHARPPFNEVAADLLHQYAVSHPVVFCDEFYAWAQDRLPETHDKRALGPVYRKAARNGWLAHSGRYRLSNIAGGSPRPEWTSLVYAGAAA